MPSPLAIQFRSGLNGIQKALIAAPVELADVPWREGGWTRKQIIGHMLDSAANSRQRFVRAATGGIYHGPNYQQEAWVAAHGYAERPWPTLLVWWNIEHEILAAVVDRIPDEALATSCSVADEAPVTLQFLIEDYLHHQHWHLAQILSGVVST